MSDERRCPKCGDEVCLFDPIEEDWLDVAGFDEDAEVWACVACEWAEEADPDEAFDYHMDNLDWLMERIADIQGAVSQQGGGRQPGGQA